MASGFSDITLKSAQKKLLSLPDLFGASDAVGSVVEVQTNNPTGATSFYLELFDKKGSAKRVTRATARNFLKYVNRRLYDGSFFHRSVKDFVLQGGGFKAPDIPFEEGGQLSEVADLGTVANQPGNSNLRGTVAMAKLGGQPDSATNQWFVNLNDDNTFLDTQNSGFTVFGKVLGRGMTVVDQLSSAEVFNFGDPFAQLPLWDLPLTEAGDPDLGPDDFVVINKARKLPASRQPFELSVESSNDSLVEATVTKKQKIRLQAAPGVSGEAEVTVRSTSLVDGSVDEQRFDVLIGQPQPVSRKPIDIFVNEGSPDDPFYRFFNADGKELKRFKINVSRTYRFQRLNQAETHPFFVSDSGVGQQASSQVRLRGEGNVDDGITGSERFTFNVRKRHRAAFKREGRLDFFCTSHPSMNGTFAIKNQVVADTSDPLSADSSLPLL